MASVAAVASSDGNLMLNSLSPSSRIDSASAQNPSGGLPQNGTPGANQGVIQSPVSAISLAISA